jgi:hypothetical protein
MPSCQDRWALAAQSTGGFHDPDGDAAAAADDRRHDDPQPGR